MDSPLSHHTSQPNQSNCQSACFDTSPERLNSMSPSELEQAMEDALSAMAEDSYDPAVIDAYLDALDRKAPMPDYPDAKRSYSAFQQRIRSLPENVANQKPPKRYPARLRSRIRTSLAAAVMTACLLGTMMVVQAYGIDVFGVIARWSESAFSFGSLPDENEEDSAYHPQKAEEGTENSASGVPEEYQELQMEFAERGLPLYYPKIPEEFAPQEPLIDVDPITDCVSFSVAYTSALDCIGFNVILHDNAPFEIYEKNDEDVEPFVCNEITHYIFKNNENETVAWMIGNVEYSITSNTSTVDMKSLIQSIYEE